MEAIAAKCKRQLIGGHAALHTSPVQIKAAQDPISAGSLRDPITSSVQVLTDSRKLCHLCGRKSSGRSRHPLADPARSRGLARSRAISLLTNLTTWNAITENEIKARQEDVKNRVWHIEEPPKQYEATSEPSHSRAHASSPLGTIRHKQHPIWLGSRLVPLCKAKHNQVLPCHRDPCLP